MTKEWEQDMDVEAKKAYAATTTPKHAGVEGTEEMLKWIWNTGFAAVAGDAISFEVCHPYCTSACNDTLELMFNSQQGVSATSWGDLNARIFAGRLGNANRYVLHYQFFQEKLKVPNI